MKSTVILFIISLFTLLNLNANYKLAENDTVEIIKDFKNLYRYKNFYLGGQPTYEALKWIKSQGVIKIINLRSEKEINDFLNYAFDEETVVKEMGFEYHVIPVAGLNDFTPEKLDEFVNFINTDEKILIHCAAAGRVTDFFMAYLIKKKGYTVNEAVKIGKSIKFVLPLEKLLNTEISMEFKQ